VVEEREVQNRRKKVFEVSLEEAEEVQSLLAEVEEDLHSLSVEVEDQDVM